MGSTQVWLSVVVAGSMLVSACGPATFTRKSVVWEPYAAAESRQRKDNVTVDLTFVDQLPPSFTVTVARCDQAGRIVVDQKNRPILETLTLGTNDQAWQKVAITNNTENVIRMNGVVIRLFDPAANQYSALTFDDLRAELYSKRPCASTEQAMNMFRVNNIFDRNMEIVPGTTTTFWVAFKPASRMMPGLWKFALYDVPVSVDPAGRPLRTTRFETRIAVKEVIDTFMRESLTATPKLIERRETTASGETKITTPGAAVVPTAAPVAAPATAAAPPSRQPVAASPSPVVPSGQPSAKVTAKAQARLNSLGFSNGKPDGIAGKRTRQATQQFQKSKGLEVNGQLDASTLKALGLNEEQTSSTEKSATESSKKSVPTKSGNLSDL